MKRAVSNFIAILILVSIVVAVSLAILTTVPWFTRYDRPPRLIARYAQGAQYNPRTISIRVGFENMASSPFCIKATSVSFYVTSHSTPDEVVDIASYSPSVVVPPGSVVNYDVDVHTSRSYNDTLAIVVFNMHSCRSVSTCSCSGNPAYTDYVSVSIRRG